MSGPAGKVKVGDLTKLKKDALEEILIREEKILSNPRIMRCLPDKGKKVMEYMEKVRLAIQHCDEAERRKSAARTELQSNHQEVQLESSEADAETMGSKSEDIDLVRALETMNMLDGDSEFKCGSKLSLSSLGGDNYFLKTNDEKKTHSLAVLDKMGRTNPSTKQKFKPNQLPQRKVILAQDRSVQAQNHQGGATAAVIDHSGAEVLSLEESSKLLQVQMEGRKRLEAKFAGQKLTEGMKFLMERYTPDDSPVAPYREPDAEEDQHSSDDDDD